jgi:cobalt/nickel transport protein
MKARDKIFIMVGVGIAIIIAVAAPYLASSNPDGLESTAEEFEEAEEKEDPVYESPMPDYIIPGLGDDQQSGAVSIAIGTVIMLVIVFVIFYGIKRIKSSGREADTGTADNNKKVIK